MSRHGDTFVSAGVRHVAVIYGSTYVRNMKAHSSRSRRRQENAGRRISMRHSGHTSRRTPRSDTFDASASHAEDGQGWHQDAATLPSLLSTCQQRRPRGTIQDCKIAAIIRLRRLTSGEDAHLREKHSTTTR